MSRYRVRRIMTMVLMMIMMYSRALKLAKTSAILVSMAAASVALGESMLHTYNR